MRYLGAANRLVPTTSTIKKTPAFLQGDSELSRITRDFDWAATALGPIDSWPAALRIHVGTILASPFPMFLFWGPEHYCFYNDAYRPSLGNTGKHPAVGRKGKELWPEIWEHIGPMIRRVLDGEGPTWREDERLDIWRNGQLEVVYWTFSYSPANDEDGNIAGVLVTCMETTLQVQARIAVNELVAERTRELQAATGSLEAANHYLQQVINLFKEPLQILSPVFENGRLVDFRYVLTNEAYAAYAAARPADIAGKRVGEVFPGYFQTSSFSEVVAAYEDGRARTWEIHYDQDGLDLYNQMSAQRFGDEVLVHFTDFTRVKKLEHELVQKISELERSNSKLEEFAHAASHDLKEPIRKVKVFTSMLREQLRAQLGAEQHGAFNKMELATARMSELVNDLLRFSHLSQQGQQKVPVDLGALFERVREDLELEIADQGAHLEVAPLPVVPGYHRQLLQSFENLVGNALKYRRPGVAPHIRVWATEDVSDSGRFAVISVADNGIGFNPQYATQIFQLFSRLHTRDQYAGTGIGLSIVQRVAEQHGGRVEAEGRPGEGATFRLWLPL
ncbi:two-component sensor histidine kinase [Flaviaesturariibacter flavus]|uniref:histidine kinase n=1 Tax=Flaviaesturariibacter flavus TaxID=2502780 RepID=A0A4R1B9L0_9BACT|nr:ATP-binding protein [Flaviaesturariibacter flavus]TCJ13587.1 two-component sensor histidine kinase [Flaviaesturariibacter flavus]